MHAPTPGQWSATIVIHNHGDELSYSVSWFHERFPGERGWRPQKRLTGRLRQPQTGDPRRWLEDCLEQLRRP